MLIFAGNMAKTPLQSIIYQFEAGAKPNPADHRSPSAARIFSDQFPEWQRRQATSVRLCAQNAYSRLPKAAGVNNSPDSPRLCWSRPGGKRPHVVTVAVGGTIAPPNSLPAESETPP